MSIHKAIIAAMGEINPIAKDRKNSMQGYNFRGIDDVYNDLQPVLAKHGIFTTSKIINDRSEERTTSKGGLLIYRILTIEWTFFHTDGSSITTQTVGEGMDSGDKASNKAMAVAHKYALLQLFAIPTEDQKDPENQSHELATTKQEQKPKELSQWARETIKNIKTASNNDLELIANEIKKSDVCEYDKTILRQEWRIRERELNKTPAE